MKTLLLTTLILAILLSGCGTTNNSSAPWHKVKTDVYSLRLPADLVATQPHKDDATILFAHAASPDKTIGGVYILRMDSVAATYPHPIRVSGWGNDNLQLLTGTTPANHERYFCIYLPDRNTGYEIVFDLDAISKQKGLAIAKTFKLND
jgi:hypothetical protein